MKKLLILLLLPWVLGCDSEDLEETQNIDTVKKYIKAVEEMDYETMASLLDDGYQGLGPSLNDSINKPQALEGWKNNASVLYETIVYEKSKFIAANIDDGDNQGNWVSNWAIVAINYKDGSESARLLANTVYQIENGKIVKSYTFYNEADVLEQLGYVFIHPDDL